MDQSTDNNDNNNSTNVICSAAEDESKRRREMLNRRPSYRKILNEISSADTAGILEAERTNENQSQSSSASTNTSQHIVVSNSDTNSVLSLAQPITVNLSSQSNSTSVTNTHTDQNNNDTIPLQVGPYLKMIPTTTMQLASDQDHLLPATVQLSNHANASQHQQVNHGIVQYASNNQEPQFFISGMLLLCVNLHRCFYLLFFVLCLIIISYHLLSFFLYDLDYDFYIQY